MTREELLDFIKCFKGHWTFTTESGKEVSKEQVIKALEQELCEDAISRQAAIEAMEYCDFTKSVNDGLALYKDSVVEALKGLPSASGTEKSNKIGHWIKSDAVLIVGYADTENYIKLPAQECSMCHKPHIKGYKAKYCPNCGAEMSEGGEA